MPELKRTGGSCRVRRQHLISFRHKKNKKNNQRGKANKKPSALNPYSTFQTLNVLSPCRATGVSTCRTLLTLVPRRSRYSADTVATLTFPPAAADGAILRHARLGAGAAVAILPRPATLTVALPAVTRPVA